MNNLELWSSLAQTDPRYTKDIKLGGYRFTTIDAQYRIKRMTESFGACGLGWGYETYAREIKLDDRVIAVVTVSLWYLANNEKCRIGGVTSCATLIERKVGRDGEVSLSVDEDAFKKAETDALTKSMSRIGMCSDVYEGCFEDDRYVKFVEKKFSEEDDRVLRAVQSIGECTSADALRRITDYAYRLRSTNEIGEESYDRIITAAKAKGKQWEQ